MDKLILPEKPKPSSRSCAAAAATGAAGPPLRRGDWVTVRSLEEIQSTLDGNGTLEGLPFMPEMIPFAGRTVRVHRRAERTCVEGAGNRRMNGTVLLEGARCDGSSHEGCQRRCLFFWREAWLKPAEAPVDGRTEPTSPPAIPGAGASLLPVTQGDRFFCQSTELVRATAGELATGNLRCYLNDWLAGESALRRFAWVSWIAVAKRLKRLISSEGYFDRPSGSQKRTRNEELGLQPGELVEVRSLEEVKLTLDASGRNRGMTFDAEMALHCGKRFRVLGPVNRMISEETGKMLSLKNTVLLQGLTCEGICVYNCPRANYFFWRECWLKRVG